MVTHLYRVVLAAILAGLSCLLGGCVLAQLTGGFTLLPPGGYVTGTFADTGGRTTVVNVATTAPTTTVPTTGAASAPASRPSVVELIP